VNGSNRHGCCQHRNTWSKEFLEAGKKRLAGDTARQATSNEAKDLCREMRDMAD
jgi:transposase